MDGSAFNWFQPMLDQYSLAQSDPAETVPEIFSTFEKFAKALENTFGDPDVVRTKEREITNLAQISSVSAYLADFNRIRGFLKWNDAALASQFYKGLKPAVKDGLVYEHPAPSTLEELAAASLRIDSRQYERLLERKAGQGQGPLAPRLPRPSYADALNRPPTTPFIPAPARPAADGSTPMELDLLSPYTPRPGSASTADRTSTCSRNAPPVAEPGSPIFPLVRSANSTHPRRQHFTTPHRQQKTLLRSDPGDPPEHPAHQDPRVPNPLLPVEPDSRPPTLLETPPYR